MHGKFWRTRRPSNHSAMNQPIIATALLAFCFACTSCGGSGKPVVAPGNTSSVLNDYHLAGATSPVRDPSIMRQASAYYLFSTDAGGAISGHLPSRCSTDKVNWQLCGTAFNQIPAWVQAAVPGIGGLWAPDISYFNGFYHLYYAGSLFATNMSVIYSLATGPGVQFNPIEGSSLVHKGNYYYLFVSFDDCCNPDPFKDTYRIMVGRG